MAHLIYGLGTASPTREYCNEYPEHILPDGHRPHLGVWGNPGSKIVLRLAIYSDGGIKLHQKPCSLEQALSWIQEMMLKDAVGQPDYEYFHHTVDFIEHLKAEFKARYEKVSG